MEDNAGDDEEEHNESSNGAGAGGDVELENEFDGDGQQFDRSLAASHSYMGSGLVVVRGRSVLEAGWRGRVPVMAHTGAVFPGEMVPMLLPNAHDAAILTRTIEQDKLFGLLCPDETCTLVSGYGVLCEVFEAGLGDTEPHTLTVKARATHRFRLIDKHRHPVPLHAYTRMHYADVRVLPEVRPTGPLRHARLASLEPLRRARSPLGRRLRAMDAALTPWPLFVYEAFDYRRMRDLIRDHFEPLLIERVPEEPVSLSFWVASNLALSARDRLALFAADDALQRLHMELRFIERNSVMCCSSCLAEIARREHILAMSSEGVHSNFTNLGGYVHDLVTVSRVGNTELSGRPSEEYSWFPGYSWTILVCGACLAHVGWRFDAVKRNLRPSRFYGLCRNYVQPHAEDEPEHL